MPAKRVCTTSRCPNLTDNGGRCDTCQRKAEALRGNARQRGYNTAGHQQFRQAVLTRNPLCVCPEPDHGHPPRACHTAAVVADHYPLSRRELIARGLNPNDPAYGRGLCSPCHSAETSRHQPGGWNSR